MSTQYLFSVAQPVEIQMMIARVLDKQCCTACLLAANVLSLLLHSLDPGAVVVAAWSGADSLSELKCSLGM
jgi:hypothetical protein